MEAAVRIAFWALPLLFAVAGTPPALAQAGGEECGAATDPKMPPDAGPYMRDLNMQEPMRSQMKRDDMMIGDVARAAAQKDKCMSGVMKLEEKTMDGRKK